MFLPIIPTSMRSHGGIQGESVWSLRVTAYDCESVGKRLRQQPRVRLKREGKRYKRSGCTAGTTNRSLKRSAYTGTCLV